MVFQVGSNLATKVFAGFFDGYHAMRVSYGRGKIIQLLSGDLDRFIKDFPRLSLHLYGNYIAVKAHFAHLDID